MNDYIGHILHAGETAKFTHHFLSREAELKLFSIVVWISGSSPKHKATFISYDTSFL